MKRNVFLAAVMMLCFSCGNQNKKNETATVETKGASPSDNPDYDKGLSLVAKSDCFSCHKLREASIGPAYGAVAAKYEATEANISLLAEKIVKGGQGVWGQVPMAAHPSITTEDATQMVKYILLLKEEKK
jgi:cytochrome c